MTPAQQDYEFWMNMAIMVEAAETMPDWDNDTECYGLCAMVEMACRLDYIQPEQSYRLEEQIKLIEPACHSTFYYWKVGAWRPRVRAMKKLAKLALE